MKHQTVGWKWILRGKSRGRHFVSVTMDDLVNHPKHYMSGTGLEVIEVIRAFSHGSHIDHEIFLWGNAVKYLLRYRHKKNPLQDVHKAEFYVIELIKLLDKAEHDKRLKRAARNLPTVLTESKVQRVQPRTQSGRYVSRKVSKKANARGK